MTAIARSELEANAIQNRIRDINEELDSWAVDVQKRGGDPSGHIGYKVTELLADRQVLERSKTELEERATTEDPDDDLERQTAERMAQLDDAMHTRASGSGHSPLLVSDRHIRSHVEAIRTGTAFGAVEVLERAKVTVATDTGSPGSWGSGGLLQPVTLRGFARIPNAKLDGATAQMPSLTLPAGAAGVAESNAHTEFDTVDVANLTTLRYGRWTDVTSFVDSFTQLQAINQAHAVGIARDLNLLDLTAIQTAAGSVTAFSASVLDQNVRAAILKVAAAVLGDPADVVLFGTSAALAVVTGYAPASGDDRGSVSTRVYGARVYVTEQAVAGNVYAFHPLAFQTFSSRLASASVVDPTTGGHKFGQWLHSTAAGVFVVGGAAGVDVVTP
jgi:hypothetical protein